MADVNVTFFGHSGNGTGAYSQLGGENITTPGVVEVPPEASSVRIVSPGALRLRVNRRAELESENLHYMVIPPAEVEWMDVAHGQFLHFHGDAFGVGDSKVSQ